MPTGWRYTCTDCLRSKTLLMMSSISRTTILEVFIRASTMTAPVVAGPTRGQAMYSSALAGAKPVGIPGAACVSGHSGLAAAIVKSHCFCNL